MAAKLKDLYTQKDLKLYWFETWGTFPHIKPSVTEDQGIKIPLPTEGRVLIDEYGKFQWRWNPEFTELHKYAVVFHPKFSASSAQPPPRLTTSSYRAIYLAVDVGGEYPTVEWVLHDFKTLVEMATNKNYEAAEVYVLCKSNPSAFRLACSVTGLQERMNEMLTAAACSLSIGDPLPLIVRPNDWKETLERVEIELFCKKQ